MAGAPPGRGVRGAVPTALAQGIHSCYRLIWDVFVKAIEKTGICWIKLFPQKDLHTESTNRTPVIIKFLRTKYSLLQYLQKISSKVIPSST